MANLRQILAGLLAGLISLIIIVGSLSLALAEGGTSFAPPPTITSTPTRIPTVLPGAPTFTPSPVPSATPTTTATSISVCPKPLGWLTILVKDGDTLPSIAVQYGMTLEELASRNCIEDLTNFQLVPDTELYVRPPAVTPSPTASVTPSFTPTSTHTTTHTPPPSRTPIPTVACGPPAGWIRYTVQPGDTLFNISQRYQTTVFALQLANCLSGTVIRIGDQLWVPNVATIAPTSTRTPVSTLTPTPSVTPVPPSVTPVTPSPTPIILPSPTPTSTETPVILPTETFTPTSTDTPTETLTPTTVPTTAVPTSTETPTP